jgi:hypothetical protein
MSALIEEIIRLKEKVYGPELRPGEFRRYLEWLEATSIHRLHEMLADMELLKLQRSAYGQERLMGYAEHWRKDVSRSGREKSARNSRQRRDEVIEAGRHLFAKDPKMQAERAYDLLGIEGEFKDSYFKRHLWTKIRH